MTDTAATVPPARCRCPSCTARAVLHLLETGRAAPAHTLMRELVEGLEAALAFAYEKGRHGALQEALRAAQGAGTAGKALKPVPPPTPAKRAENGGKPAFPRTAAELREHVARLGPRRVAELLCVTVRQLGPMLDGRVDVAKSALDRVRRAG